MENNYIFNIYKIVLNRIGSQFDTETIKEISRGYNLLYFNIFNLVGDMSVLNIAHAILDKTVLLRQDLVFPIIGRKIDSNEFIMISDYHEKGFFVIDPKNGSVEIITRKKIIDSFDKWILMLEPTKIHEIERKEHLILHRNMVKWLKRTSAIVITIILIYWLIISSFVTSILMVVSLLGLVVSHLLILKKYGKEFEVVEKICDAFKQKHSCKKAVDFKFDNIISDFISLPALGFLFFSFSFLVFGASSYVPSAGHSYWVLIVYLFALLSSLFLFGLQHFKLKTYCPLCIAVTSLIILLNLVVFFSWSFNNWHFNSLLFSWVISMAVAFLVSNNIKLEEGLALSQVFLRRNRWDATVFRGLLQSTREVQFNNNNRLMVNFQKGNTLLNIHISDSCEFCKPYLKEFLSLLLLEENYSLAIYLKSNIQAEKSKLEWLKSTFEHFFYEYSSIFYFRVGGVVGTLEELIQKHDDGKLEAGFLDADDRVLQYPSSFLDKKQVPPMYEGKDIKRHLVLLKYK